MDRKQQLLQTVSLGNKAKSRNRTGSQNVEIETLSCGRWETPTAHLCKPSRRRWNQSSGRFHWVNPVSLEGVHFHNDNSRKRSTRSSPASLLSHWWERKRERNEFYCQRDAWVHGLQSDSWSNAESDSGGWIDIPFTSLRFVWVNMKRSLGEFLGYSLPLPQSLWQHMT